MVCTFVSQACWCYTLGCNSRACRVLTALEALPRLSLASEKQPAGTGSALDLAPASCAVSTLSARLFLRRAQLGGTLAATGALRLLAFGCFVLFLHTEAGDATRTSLCLQRYAVALQRVTALFSYLRSCCQCARVVGCVIGRAVRRSQSCEQFGASICIDVALRAPGNRPK